MEIVLEMRDLNYRVMVAARSLSRVEMVANSIRSGRKAMETN